MLFPAAFLHKGTVMCDLPGCWISDLPFHVLINICHLTEVCLCVCVYMHMHNAYYMKSLFHFILNYLAFSLL